MPCRTRRALVAAVLWLTLHAAPLPPAAAGPLRAPLNLTAAGGFHEFIGHVAAVD